MNSLIEDNRRIEFQRIAILSLGYYLLTSLVVFFGVWFSTELIHRQHHPLENEPGLLNAFSSWDGYWYTKIASEGYEYDPTTASSVAFFPAFPATGAALMWISGLEAEQALLIVSQIYLVGVFFLLAVYVRARYPESSLELTDYTLLAMGLWPTTMFYRMVYTESMFVFFLLLAMLGMFRSWHPFWIALIVGFATATRAVGIALLIPSCWFLWQRSSSRLHFLANAAWLAPLGCWGIVAYMVFQYYEFGSPFAFMQTQTHWVMRSPVTALDQSIALLTLEPIWSVFIPSSEAYWARHESLFNPLFSLQFANPIYFVFFAVLIGLGVWKKWLTTSEWLLAATLLLIPYVSHSYRAIMMAQGRYAASIFPVYMVLGQIAIRLPAPLVAIFLCFSGFLLGLYSVLFAAWYRFI